MNDFEGVIPILNVKDLAASIDYFVNKLGFKINWESEFFSSVSRGKASIFLCQGAQGQPGVWMSIFLKDVDALYEEYKNSGAIIIEPPMNFPWEHREMLIGDLDGHRLRMTGDPTGPPDDGYMNTERSRSQP
jgi:catechol 2,3-dioxygenase-like lactoylglutathione lyase family enzyme